MSALFRWVSLRHLLAEAPRTALTVAGVALGVAVVVSVRIASDSAMASFADTVDAVAGRANLEVRGTGEGFDERVYLAARAVPGVLAAAPVVEVFAPAAPGAAGGAATLALGERGRWSETLLVLGVDLLAERPFGRVALADTADLALGREAALAFLAARRAAAITTTLADRHGLARGDTLTVLASGRREALVVERIVASEGLRHAYGGNVVVTDISTAQEVFGRIGALDRIDLRVDPARRDAVAAAVRAAVPAALTVGAPAGRTRQVENMVRAFDLNLTALSLIALFVASFLIYTAVSSAVVRRRREIGILRALGVGRGAIARLVVAEAVALGLAGGAAGVALGILFARATLGAVSRTLSELYLVRHAGRLDLEPVHVALAIALAVVVAVASALAPALEAARTRPALTTREGADAAIRPIAIGRWTAIGLALLAAGAAVALWTVREQQPLGGFASAVLVLGGFSLLAPGVTLALEVALQPLVRRLVGIEGVLGARFLREAVGRTSAVVAALMVAVGMLTALTVMVESFRRTVDTWITQTVRGDLYVEPVGHRLLGSATALPDSLVTAARALDGVRAVDTFRGTRVAYGDRVAFVAGIDFDVQRERGHLRFLGGDARAILAAARDGGAIVTESFRHHHGVDAGDSVVIAGAAGPVRLPVHGVLIDYSTDAGAVLLDRGTYARVFDDDRTESLALFVAPGVDVDDVRRRFLALAGPDLVLHAIPNQELRRRVLTVFDQTFQVTWALQGIALIVAVLGVVSTLTALVLQRSREIATLRAAGALRRQIVRIVLAESGMLGLIGGLLGSACGLALAALLVHVINRQFFGWTIEMTLEPGVFVRAVALVVATSLLAGLAPARLAAGRVAVEAMREE